MREQACEIKAKKRYFYFADECHLIWGDACGYAWGKCGTRLRIPMTNERIRQIYFGVINVLSGKVSITRHKYANAMTTIEFLKELMQKHRGAKITLCWDKVPYHRSRIVEEFIRKINHGLSKRNKRLMVIELAPHAPKENPMEEIWLYGKTSIRKAPQQLFSFEDVKNRFEKSLKWKKFKFNKLRNFQKVLHFK